MRPDENDDTRRVGTPLIPQRSLLHTPTERQTTDRASSQHAAAQIVRDQINSIYGNETPAQTAPATQQTEQPTQQQTLAVSNPYERTHTPTPQPQAEQWKQYHSAWQDYYQKYYERYYAGQVHQAKQAFGSQQTAQTATQPSDTQPESPREITKQEALNDLRSKLKKQVAESAGKIRKSRHFIPISAAALVALIFVFLQYNQVLFANVQAYVVPGNIDPQNIIVDPTVDANVGPESKLIIPKINVEAPIAFGVGNDYNSQMKAMETGVAHFSIPGASSVPGQTGNTVLAGHSSNDAFVNGDYKFIFAQNEKLHTGDTIYVNYESKRYAYRITTKEVVMPEEVSKLVYPTDKPVLTLVSCVPLGTALKRLLITAEQVSPDPTAAATAPTADAAPKAASIPGSEPTFLERIFGGGR
ncbi:Sortase family protein [compost metagenome]